MGWTAAVWCTAVSVRGS